VEQQKLKSRAEIPDADKWHLEDIFADNNEWEQEFAQVEKLLKEGKKFQGHLAENADTLISCFEWMDDLSLRLEEVYAYARMRRDEDNRIANYQALTDRAGALAVKVSSAASYVVPELLAMPEGKLDEFRATSTKMELYHQALDDILRKKEHVLSSVEERLLAEVGELAEAPGAIFSMANNADLKFPNITDESGKPVELTKGNFIQFMESQNQEVRKEAFQTLYSTYDKQRNTWAATLNSSVKSDVFYAKARRYPSALEASLDDDRVPLKVYDSLIDTVQEFLPQMHRYVQLRKKALKLDELHMYDIYVPIVPETSMKIAYEEAKASLVVLSRRKIDFIKTYQRFAPLGAMLKRIEREITVAEQSYLELLRSLNLAKMRQQNLQMATNIRIVDPPYFPIMANPSKAKYLVLAAAIIGFILVAFIILVLEYFDASLKTPNRISEKIGLKLAGAYPLFDSANDAKDLVYVSNRLIEMIVQNIKLKLKHNSLYPSSKPYLILFFSTEEGVGKSFVAGKIANKLRTYGDKVLMLNYSHESNSIIEEDYNFSFSYIIQDNFAEISNIHQLIDSNTLRRDNYQYDYIFLEIPSIIHNAYPLELLQTTDVNLLIIKSSSHWEKADVSALQMIKEVSKEEPMVILNQAEDFAIQELISGFNREKQNNLLQKLKYIVLFPSRIRFQVKEN